MKKKFFTSTILAIAGAGMVVGSANATPVFGDGGGAVQTVLNSITTGGTSSVNASTDFLPDSLDQTWSLTASGGSVSTIILEEAGFVDINSFGIFDATDPTKTVQLFGGTAGAGSQATVSINDVGQVFINQVATGVTFSDDYFGYYLASEGNTFYSIFDYNSDGLDHMAAYQGSGDEVKLPTWPPGSWTANEYILAWEDLAGGGDGDFNDFVAMVESVEPASAPQPVPEPATMLLLGAGLAGLGAVSRRKAKK